MLNVIRHRQPVAGSVLAAGLVLAVDQATKAAAIARLHGTEDILVLVDEPVVVGSLYDGFFRVALTLFWNRGPANILWPAHGDPTMTGGAQAIAPELLVAVTAAIIVGLGLWILATSGRWARCALGAVAGGAVGNAIDRVRFGGVADFLSVHLSEIAWAVFNVADVAIVGGACIKVGLWMLAPGPLPATLVAPAAAGSTNPLPGRPDSH